MAQSTLAVLPPSFPQLLKWKSVKSDQAAIEQARRELGPDADPKKLLARAMRIRAQQTKDNKSAAVWYVLQAELAMKAVSE